jgi:hypothetical protein
MGRCTHHLSVMRDSSAALCSGGVAADSAASSSSSSSSAAAGCEPSHSAHDSEPPPIHSGVAVACSEGSESSPRPRVSDVVAAVDESGRCLYFHKHQVAGHMPLLTSRAGTVRQFACVCVCVCVCVCDCDCVRL